MLSAHPAKALAEGTRLLMAGPQGPVTRRQGLLADNVELPTTVKVVPWTLLTQSNIQLRLKPAVAAAGTQTEDACQTDELSVGTVAHIDSAVLGKAQGHCHLAGPLITDTSSHAVQPSQLRTNFAAAAEPVSIVSNKHSSQLQTFFPAKTARTPVQLRYPQSPNAHMMFQSEVRKPPIVTFTPGPALPVPSNSPACPRHQAIACLTPARTGEDSCRRSSLSSLSAAPAIGTPTLPAAGIAAVNPSPPHAAVSPTDPSEIQLTDAGMTTSSCKSASSAPSELESDLRRSKDPSEIQLTEEVPAPSHSNHRAGSRSKAHTAQARPVTLPSAANTNKAARLSALKPSDIHSSKAGNAAGNAAMPCYANPSSKAAAAAVTAAATAAVCKSPISTYVQNPQVSVKDYAESATQTLAHSHSQHQPVCITQSAAQVASCSAGPDAAAGRSSPHRSLKASSSFPLPTEASEALLDQPRTEGGPLVCINASVPTSASSVPQAADQAADTKQHGQQAVMQPLEANSLKPGTHSEAAATTTAAAAAGAKSTSSATVCTGPHSGSPVKTRGKSQPAAEAEQQPGSAGTVDALRTDLISTAGCHVTRRLVQRLLEPVSRPAKRAAITVRGSSARGSQPPASQKASSNSQANKAQRSLPAMSHVKPASSNQLPEAPKAAGASAAADSQGKACSTEQGKQVYRGKGRMPAAKDAVIKKQQQSMPPPATAKASQSKPSTHKAATVRLAKVSVSLTPGSQSKGRADPTRSASYPYKQSNATQAASDNDKADNSTAPGNSTDAASKPVTRSTAGRAPASSNDMTTQQGGITSVAIKPSPSASDSRDSQPSYSSADQVQSGMKRQRSDASVAAASAPVKKPKVSLHGRALHFLLASACFCWDVQS